RWLHPAAREPSCFLAVERGIPVEFIEVWRMAMSCRSKSARKRALSGILLTLALAVVSAAVQAQDQPTPKADVFVGYQWLNPGATVPAPSNPSSAPVPFQLKDMAKGFGGAVAYNFDRHFALEVDLGHNWGDQGYELTTSVGPRLMLHTEGMNFFAHTLLGLNRLNVNGLSSDNGIGAILGGGMDMPIIPKLSIRLFEADYVWAAHHYSQ